MDEWHKAPYEPGVVVSSSGGGSAAAAAAAAADAAAAAAAAAYKPVELVRALENHVKQLERGHHDAEGGCSTDSVNQDVADTVPHVGGFVEVTSGGYTACNHVGDAGDGGGNPVLVQKDENKLLGQS